MKNIIPRLSRITLKDWLEYHPYDREVSSDHYYIGLSNDIQHEIFHIDINGHLTGADYKHLACMLACYFEDIVGRVGIWTSFVNEHRRLYGAYLPFYDTAGYEHGEVNLPDIQFLVWHFCSNLSFQNHIIDPYSLENGEIARIVFDLLNGQTGQAPENEDMKKSLTLPPDADMDRVKTLMDFFFFGSYLNYYYATALLEEVILDLKNQKGVRRENMGALINDRRTDLLFNAAAPLLAMRAGEILAGWAGESHPQHENLIALSEWKKGTYLFRDATPTCLRLEHLATGVQLDVAGRPDIHVSIPLIPGKTLLEAGLVEYGGQWRMVGEASPADKSRVAEAAVREKSLFASVASQLGIVRRQEECFLELTGNSRLAFFGDKRSIFSFIDELWDLYHLRFGAESTDRRIFDVHGVTFGIDDDLENAVVFFNSNAGMEFYPEMAQCIAAANNPYFHPTAETNIEDFLLNENISAAFVACLVKNRMIEIEPLSGEGGFNYVWDHYDFLLRYWKRERYLSQPKLFIE